MSHYVNLPLILYIHQFTDITFQFLGFMNKIAMEWIGKHLYSRMHSPLGICPQMVSWTLIFLRSHHTDFHSGCLSLYYHQQWMNVPFTLHSYQVELLFVLLILATVTGIIWHLKIILICIFLMTKDVEHFFMYFSSICVSSFENTLFSSIPI